MTVAAHASDDRLTDLALRLLGTEEADRTLAHLRVCSDCETRFREICLESEILLARPHPPAIPGEVRVRARLSGVEREATHPRMRWRAIWGVAAAAIVVAVAVGVGVRQDDSAFDYWLSLEPEQVIVRSKPPAGTDAFLSEAIEAYRRRDTHRVVALLQERAIPDGHEPLKLVLASALVWERRPAQARILLDELDIDTLPLPARDRARWILLTALWQEGDRSSAERILHDLASRPGEFSERARRQLAAIP